MKKTFLFLVIVALLALSAYALAGTVQNGNLRPIIVLVNYVQLLLILASAAAALFVHHLSWLTRLQYLAVATSLGLVVFAILATFSLIFMFPEPGSGADGAYVMQSLAIGVWALGFPCVLMLGALQARSLQVPWWKGVLSVFFEAGLSLLMVAGFNYFLHWYISMMDTRLLLGVHWERAALFFVICLAVLAVIRPIVRLSPRRLSATGPA